MPEARGIDVLHRDALLLGKDTRRVHGIDSGMKERASQVRRRLIFVEEDSATLGFCAVAGRFAMDWYCAKGGPSARPLGTSSR